jgi:hypothetical protein
MKKIILYISVCTILMLVLFLNACTKQNEQTLSNNSGGQVPCDTTNMSYFNDINPILENNCVGCHNTTQANDGVILTDYNDVLTQVNNGDLINVIEHNPGYPEMPEGLAKLPSCTINKIVAWVNRGAPNN